MLPSEETRLRLLRKFRVETAQNIITLRNNLPQLCTPENKDAIISMFFAAHTIKGSVGMMQLLDDNMNQLNAPASHIEAVMLSLRNQEFVPDATTVQEIEDYLQQIESQFQEGLAQ